MPSNTQFTGDPAVSQNAGPANTQLQNAPQLPNTPMDANSMSAADPMAAFKDLQMPDAVSWWPLAWGWWVIIAIALIILAALIYALIKHQQQKRAKKQAIKLINQLPDTTTSIALNQLLKQVMLSYYPRQQVAQLSGNAWLAFLVAQLPDAKKTQFKKQFLQFNQSLYQPNKRITSDDKMLIIQYIKQIKTQVKSTKYPDYNRQTGEAKHV